MIYLFHGEESFQKDERIAALKAELRDDALGDLNIAQLDGRNLGRETLQHHCDVAPFLSDKRLVIVVDLIKHLGSSDAASDMLDWLQAYLPTVPGSTDLVLNEGARLAARHPLLKAVTGLGKRGEVREFQAPTLKSGDLVRWVEERARGKGARLQQGVAADLALFMGPDLRLIDSELEKLALYASDRPVSKEDVRLLVPYAQQANIFDMVDALGHRQTQQAFRLLAQLRSQGAHDLYLLTMIVRQYRILLQVQELAGRGMSRDDIARQIGLHTFPTGKAMSQARNYTPRQLFSIYDRLLDTDVAIKTGQMEAGLAIDLLVVELARV